jgi:hypothetical protein
MQERQKKSRMRKVRKIAHGTRARMIDETGQGGVNYSVGGWCNQRSGAGDDPEGQRHGGGGQGTRLQEFTLKCQNRDRDVRDQFNRGQEQLQLDQDSWAQRQSELVEVIHHEAKEAQQTHGVLQTVKRQAV